MAPVQKPKPILGRTFLQQWREYRGHSQQDAADAINVSRGLLSKIENAQSPYLQQHLEGLAKFYNCSPSDLLCRDPNDTQSMAALISLANQAPEIDQEQIKQFIRFKLSLSGK